MSEYGLDKLDESNNHRLSGIISMMELSRERAKTAMMVDMMEMGKIISNTGIPCYSCS